MNYEIVAKARERNALGAFYPTTVVVRSASRPTSNDAVMLVNQRGYEVNYIISIKPHGE